MTGTRATPKLGTEWSPCVRFVPNFGAAGQEPVA
jgi:hypothetical protein